MCELAPRCLRLQPTLGHEPIFGSRLSQVRGRPDAARTWELRGRALPGLCASCVQARARGLLGGSAFEVNFSLNMRGVCFFKIEILGGRSCLLRACFAFGSLLCALFWGVPGKACCGASSRPWARPRGPWGPGANRGKPSFAKAPKHIFCKRDK